MANRIIRGFTRLGVGVAAVIFQRGLGFTVLVASTQYERLSLAAIPPFDPNKPYEVVEPGMFDDLIPPPIFVAAKTAGVGVGVTFVLALAAFGFFRGVGWIVDGFAGD